MGFRGLPRALTQSRQRAVWSAKMYKPFETFIAHVRLFRRFSSFSQESGFRASLLGFECGRNSADCNTVQGKGHKLRN